VLWAGLSPDARVVRVATPLTCARAQNKGNEQFSAQAWEAAVAQYEEALGVLGGALAVPTLRERPDMADLLRRVHAAHAACHLNLAAVAAKARERARWRAHANRHDWRCPADARRCSLCSGARRRFLKSTAARR